MPAYQLVSKLLNGQCMSHLCIIKCMLNDTYAEYIVLDKFRQQFNMCKKFSSHAWCILAFKCLALNIWNFGREDVWHWFTQWTVLLINPLTYITLAWKTCIVKMPVSEPGWIRTLHERKCEETFWTEFYNVVLIVLTRWCLNLHRWHRISLVSCIADIVSLLIFVETLWKFQFCQHGEKKR